MAEKKVTPTEVQSEEAKIEPVMIYDKNGNFKYLLEFDRNTVKFAEQRGLKPQTIEGNMGMIEIEELFYCSFRKHQPKMSKADTDKVIKEIGGITPKLLIRLCQLFELPYTELLTDDENEENEKNSVLTVKF